MKTNDATETAYKNGYKKGYEDGERDTLAKLAPVVAQLESREQYAYRKNIGGHCSTNWNGKYVAYHYAVELIKRAIKSISGKKAGNQ